MYYLNLMDITSEQEALECAKKLSRMCVINNNSTKRDRFSKTKTNDSGLGALEDICVLEGWTDVLNWIQDQEMKFSQVNEGEKSKSRKLKGSY
jgi:hypothetical protein